MVNQPRGLNFKGWMDAIQNMPDKSIIGNFELDDLNPVDINYLKYMIEWRGGFTFYEDELESTNIPPDIQNARGIGNWSEPKLILITKTLEGRLKNRASPLWLDHPEYKRLRPFSSSITSRQYITDLLCQSPLDLNTVYITCVDKCWSMTPETILQNEFYQLSLQQTDPLKIICLSQEAMTLFINIMRGARISLNLRLMDNGKNYRKNFNSLIE